MANYKGIANTSWGKHMRENIKWKKSTYGSKKDPVIIHGLYLGNKHIGDVSKSKFGPKPWMYSIHEPAIGGAPLGNAGYTDSFQDAKRKVLYYSNLLQFYKQ